MTSKKSLFQWIRDLFTKKDRQLEDVRDKLQARIKYLEEYGKPGLQHNNEMFKVRSKEMYLRSNNEQSIAESNQIIASFPETMSAFADRTDYVCHGVPFWALQRIVSQPDVLGNNLRQDAIINTTFEGQISPKEIAVHPMSDISYALADAEMDAYKECLPSGVVFILSADGQTPEQQRPINHFGNEMCLNAVNLNETNRIEAILTTSETKEQVENLLREYGYEKTIGKVCTFTEYENLIQYELQQQNQGYDSMDIEEIQ